MSAKAFPVRSFSGETVVRWPARLGVVSSVRWIVASYSEAGRMDEPYELEVLHRGLDGAEVTVAGPATLPAFASPDAVDLEVSPARLPGRRGLLVLRVAAGICPTGTLELT